MWRMFLPIVVAGWFASTTAAAETRWRDQFLLINSSKPDERPGLAILGQNLESLGVEPGSDIAEFLGKSNYDKWKVFEDEHVRFSYPDYPGMTVEVSSRADPKPVPVYGAPLRTVPYHFGQVYRVTLGDLTYALLFLQKAEHLDNAICFCGEIVHRGMFVHDGCLYEYALLESGKLKSMQVLGEGWRAQLFEWTHSLMTPSMYASLAESVVLKHPHTRSDEEWREFLRKDPQRVMPESGWLRRGMDQDSMIKLFGQPTRQSARALEYVRINQEILAKFTLHIPLEGGSFQGFSNSIWRYEEIPPERGTLKWAWKLADSISTGKAKRGPALTKDGKLAMERFLQEAPQAEPEAWNDWCWVANVLADVGVRRPEVLEIVEQRFLDPTCPSNSAAWILEKYKSKNAQSLFRSRIRLTLDGTAKIADSEQIPDSLRDLHNLLAFLDSAAARAPFVREAIVHPHHSIRGDGTYFLDSLPKAEAYSSTLLRLDDEDESVRRLAVHWVAKFGSTSDIPQLEARLAKEEKETVRETFAKTISSLKKNSH